MNERTERRPSVDGSIEKTDIEYVSSSITSEKHKFIASPAEKKVVKKINRAFAPFLCLILFIQVQYLIRIIQMY